MSLSGFGTRIDCTECDEWFIRIRDAVYDPEHRVRGSRAKTCSPRCKRARDMRRRGSQARR